MHVVGNDLSVRTAIRNGLIDPAKVSGDTATTLLSKISEQQKWDEDRKKTQKDKKSNSKWNACSSDTSELDARGIAGAKTNNINHQPGVSKKYVAGGSHYPPDRQSEDDESQDIDLAMGSETSDKEASEDISCCTDGYISEMSTL